jgi:hypothetical protein
MGVAEKWTAFSKAWRDCLIASPPIRYLKMAEAAKCKGEFRHFDPDERNAKLRRLVEIIKRFPPQKAFHVTFDLQALKQHTPPYVPKPMSNPYFIGCFAILGVVGNEVVDSRVEGELELIFDEQLIFWPRVKMWYPLIKAAMQGQRSYDFDRLFAVLPPEPLSRDDKKCVPLQIADMLVWLCRMGYSGERHEFEWIAEELAPVIPFSEYSAPYDADRLKHTMSLKVPTISHDLIRAWRKNLGHRP